MTQHQTLSRRIVLSEIGQRANGAEITKVKVTKKRQRTVRGLAFGSQVCIILEQSRKVVGYNFFSKKNKDKVNEYIHLFFSSGKVLGED